ncbi:hypothetical protein [Nonomuraea recticatena]
MSSIVLGSRNAGEVRRNAALAARPVPEEVWTELTSEGLVGLPG